MRIETVVGRKKLISAYIKWTLTVMVSTCWSIQVNDDFAFLEQIYSHQERYRALYPVARLTFPFITTIRLDSSMSKDLCKFRGLSTNVSRRPWPIKEWVVMLCYDILGVVTSKARRARHSYWNICGTNRMLMTYPSI